jgi:adenylate cyclase, class 2
MTKMKRHPQQETEIKFFIIDVQIPEKRLKELSAVLVSNRTHELNYRYDTPDLKLTSQMQVLRLRQDRSAYLTFKGAADPSSEVSTRQEIEFGVSDFDTAHQFLQALGYQVTFVYEKFRTTYHLNDCEIMLDELPYGNFLEIEGDDIASIKEIAGSLNLEWVHRIKLSYLAIFSQMKGVFGLNATNLVFSEFEKIKIPMDELIYGLLHAK